MKLGFVYDAVLPWETGGVQRRVWELGRRLQNDYGHDVHWYGLQYWDGDPTIDRDGVTIHGVMEPPDLYVGQDGQRSISEALEFAARLVRPLRGESFDVIDCQEFPYFPAFSAKLRTVGVDTPLVLTWHEVWDDYWYEYLGSKGVFGKAIERLTARVPDAHLAVSERTRSDATGIGARDVSLLPNGISLAEIRAAPEADQDVDLLFVGRLIPEKNPDLVVETVSELARRGTEAECVVLGEGPERDAAEALASKQGLDDQITFLDFREDYADVLGLMKAADVFLFPSQREGFGITALEALGSGTPVVTTDHHQNAAQALVEDGMTGAVCELTPVALATGVERARTCVPGDCVGAARSYDWDRLAAQADAYYREVAR